MFHNVDFSFIKQDKNIFNLTNEHVHYVITKGNNFSKYLTRKFFKIQNKLKVTVIMIREMLTKNNLSHFFTRMKTINSNKKLSEIVIIHFMHN